MMRAKPGGIVSLIYLPFFAGILLLGLFALIWLRSSIVQTSYSLRNLEEKKMESLKDMKMLLAERAKLMSLDKLDVLLSNSLQRDGTIVAGGYIFPDRVKVIQVKRHKAPETYRASLDTVNKN
jgi:hypothetical protein